MNKPKLVKKYLTEGYQLQHPQIVNILEILQYMLDNWPTAENKPQLILQYATGSDLISSPQIENITEVVQWMVDNWGSDISIIPKLDYPLFCNNVFTGKIATNISNVVEALYNNWESARTTKVELDDGQVVNINDPSKSVELSGEFSTSCQIVGKDITISELAGTANTGDAFLLTGETVTINDSNLSGSTNASSNLIKVMEAEETVIDGTEFGGLTYNTVMTGQTTQTFLKKLDITNCVFNEDCKHVNIWAAGLQDGGVVNIKNCTFKTCEQFLCLSDFSGTENNVEVNIENVEISQYQQADDKYKEYNGIILLDDRICQSEEEFLDKAPFGKFTIRLTNVTAGGVKLTSDNFTIGSKELGQMLYVYCAKAKKTYAYNSDTAYLFPTVIVNGVTITP